LSNGAHARTIGRANLLRGCITKCATIWVEAPVPEDVDEIVRILLLNPNTSQSITDILAAVAVKAAAPGTLVIPVTAPRGVPYISSRAEAQIAGAIALETLAERQGTYDGAIIAAFGDPGLFAARELFDVPVVGMSEAAMLTACMLGKRFGIVTFAAAMEAWYRDCVEQHGLAPRCAGIRCLDGAFKSIDDVQGEKEAALVELANKSVTLDGADVVILAGAPLAGLAARVADRIPVPLVDQAAAAVKQTEALIALGTRKATEGGFRRPSAKPSSGLAPRLAARIAHEDGS
jgi:allantoin racemase